jgi:dTDP-4-amino-4,6-dideoxygalactose transaminase
MPLSATIRVPFLDLAAQHRALEAGIQSDLSEIVGHSAFVNGPHVATFEERFAEYCGVSHCVGVSNGLDALRLALIALDLEPGAEVLVPAMTFVATWEAVTQAGAVLVPVDVSADDYALDVEAVEAALGERTRAIVPVHLYGQLADMGRLHALSEAKGVAIVEDAAQAHGASRAGRRAGATGLASAFSFYPGKNLGAMGDAGALVTNDPEIAARTRALREHGQRRKYQHDEVGWTARLDTFQAAVLSRKLPLLDGWNEERRRLAGFYLDALDGVGDLVLPPVPSGSLPVWHLFVVRTADPEGLAEHLAGHEIATGRHYPEPPHLSGAYAALGYRDGSYPVAEAIGRDCLSLPIFPGMSEAQVLHVVDSVTAWFRGG